MIAPHTLNQIANTESHKTTLCANQKTSANKFTIKGNAKNHKRIENTLNKTWLKAACFFIWLSPKAPITAVIVVPRNAHMINAIPWGNTINPACAAVKVMTTIAELECINKVNRNATPKYTITGKEAYRWKSIPWVTISILSFIYPKPRNKRPSQTNALDIWNSFPCLKTKTHNPHNQITNKEIVEILNFNPTVPSTISGRTDQIFVPTITPTAWGRLTTPAPTKARISKETTLLLWRTEVTNVQVKIAFIWVSVNFLNIFLKVLVVRFFIASSKTCIPKRNKPNHHINIQRFVQENIRYTRSIVVKTDTHTAICDPHT